MAYRCPQRLLQEKGAGYGIRGKPDGTARTTPRGMSSLRLEGRGASVRRRDRNRLLCGGSLNVSATSAFLTCCGPPRQVPPRSRQECNKGRARPKARLNFHGPLRSVAPRLNRLELPPFGLRALTYAGQGGIVGLVASRKGKPLVREGRKVTGLPEFAGPPK